MEATAKPKPVVVVEGNTVRETWPNGGQMYSFGGETIYLSGRSPDGKMWSKSSVRTGIHNQAWKSDAVIRRRGKEWVWSIGPNGPIWIPYIY